METILKELEQVLQSKGMPAEEVLKELESALQGQEVIVLSVKQVEERFKQLGGQEGQLQPQVAEEILKKSGESLKGSLSSSFDQELTQVMQQQQQKQ